jgi:hypothetical protein
VVAAEGSAEAGLHVVVWGEVVLQHPGDEQPSRLGCIVTWPRCLLPAVLITEGSSAATSRLHGNLITSCNQCHQAVGGGPAPCLACSGHPAETTLPIARLPACADGSEATIGDKKAFGGAAEPLAPGTRVVVREQDTLLVVVSKEDHVSSGAPACLPDWQPGALRVLLLGGAASR